MQIDEDTITRLIDADTVTTFANANPELARLCVYRGDKLIYPRDRSSEIVAAIAELSPALHIAQKKDALKAAVDIAAETERLKYITPGEGQALTYMQKSDEARRYLSAEEPVASDYPLLSAEVGITAPDIGGVASVVHAAYSHWQQIGAAIEAARIGGKAAIEAAETGADAQAAYDAIVWLESVAE